MWCGCEHLCRPTAAPHGVWCGHCGILLSPSAIPSLALLPLCSAVRGRCPAPPTPCFGDTMTPIKPLLQHSGDGLDRLWGLCGVSPLGPGPVLPLVQSRLAPGPSGFRKGQRPVYGVPSHRALDSALRALIRYHCPLLLSGRGRPRNWAPQIHTEIFLSEPMGC